MIDRDLPRLGWRNRFAVDELVEAFSYTLMASYDPAEFTARHNQSVWRAWGTNDVQYFARVLGGRPGYRIAYFVNPGVSRITVAIEGMHTLSQLWAAFLGANSISAAPLPGVVYHAFQTYANTIKAELLANEQFTAVFSGANVGVCFTGFSLGAAVAEYLSASFIATHPAQQYRLIKFASPRVGNSDWVNNAELPLETVNVYAHSDPIDLIPRCTMRQLELRLFAHLETLTFYAKNLRQQRLSNAGNFDLNEHEDTYANYVRACIGARGAMIPTNPWYWHNIQAYRLCLMNSIASLRTLLPSRLRYMEFPGDERWGQNYRPGTLDFAGLVEPADPQTAEVEVPNNDDEELMHTTRAAAPIIQQVPMREGTSPRPVVRPPQPLWVPRRTRNL